MARCWFIFITAILVASLRGFAGAQPPSEIDRSRSEFEQAMKGESRTVDPELLKRSKKNWEQYEAAISRAMAEQDQARVTGGSDADRILDKYDSKAAMTDSPLDHYLAGRMFGLVGRLDEARTHFDRALKLDPYFYWAHHGLATYFANREMFEPAVKNYQRVLDLNDGYTNSRRGMALCLMRLGRREESEVELRRILERTPLDVETLMLLGTVLTEGSRFAEAIDIYSQVQRLDPELPQLRFEMARAYARSDQADRAVSIYEESIAKDNKDWRSCIELADIFQRQGLNHRTADAYQKALDRLPPGARVDRVKVEERIAALRSGPERETIDPDRKSPVEWLEILASGDTPEKRREAMRTVDKFPWVDAKIPQAILHALKDRDPEVVILALRCLGREWPPDDFESLARIVRLFLKNKNESVRAMAARVLSNGSHPICVAALMAAVDDQSAYAFREIHSGLNRLTFAYIDVDVPETIDAVTRQRIAAAWKTWYEANRDRYLKYEEETKNR